MPDLVSRLRPTHRMDCAILVMARPRLRHRPPRSARVNAPRFPVRRSRGTWGPPSHFPGEAPYRGPALSFRLGWPSAGRANRPTRDQKFPAKASGESCCVSWRRANFRHFWAIRRRATRTWGSTVLPHVEAFRRSGAEVFGHAHRKPLAPSSSVLPDNTTSLAFPEEGPLTEGLGRGLPSERLRAIPPTRD